MSTAKFESLLAALENLAEFARSAGVKPEAERFEKLYARLEKEKRSSKDFEEDVWTARGIGTFKISNHIEKQPLDAARRAQLNAEFARLKQALDDALFPPKPAKFPETDVPGLAGNKEHTKVFGDPRDAERIAKAALDVVQRFATAVFRRDLETAYGLCANELRGWMSVKRFVTELGKADQQFGGPANECLVERISLIWADDAARRQGNSQGAWPKDTPSPNKRAIVGTFWFTNRAQNQGRWVALWVTEEAEGYRVAKFSQYVQ